MDEKEEFIINKLNKKTFLNKWINGLYKEKSIIIHGKPGTGKSTLANYILKDFTIIKIDLDFYKSNQNLFDYLESSLYKKSIIMMFQQNKNTFKSIIFDDLDFIQQNDKKNFQSILEFSKRNKKNHPIIYITNSIHHKNINTLYQKCFPININLSKNDYKYIIKNYILDDEKKTTDLDELIKKSNHNLHSIKVNINFHKNPENIQQINSNSKITNNNLYLNNQSLKQNTKELYRLYGSEYITYGLNLIENLPKIIFANKKLSYKSKLKLMNKIYELHCMGDNQLTSVYNLNNWDLIEACITNIIVYPIHLLKKNKISLTCEMKYNHYLSKSIIHTYHSKLFNDLEAK